MLAAGTARENLEKIKALVKKAIDGTQALDIVCFPEYSYFVPRNKSKSLAIAEDIPGMFTEAISSLAKKYSVYILSGTFVDKAPDRKVYNTALFFDRSGTIIGKYQKIHLADVMGHMESSYMGAGNDMAVFDTDIGKVGMMVCYDLRFPELPRSMVLRGAEIIFIPAFFPVGALMPSRIHHWDLLTRSVALLNLTYVVAVNQMGKLHGEYPCGLSSVIDPWGYVISRVGKFEDVVYSEIDLDYERAIRESIGSLKNRRPDLYKL